MEFSAEMIASFLNGEVVGNKNITVSSVAKIEEAVAGELAFLANPKYEHYVYTTGASIVMVNRTFEPTAPIAATLVKVEDAYAAFGKLLELYVASKPQKSGISSFACVSNKAKLGKDAYIGEFSVIDEDVLIGDSVKIYPHVYIGLGVKIANNVTIHSGVKIYEGCVIGNNAVIHSGAVIGADGFGFAPVDGKFEKIQQIGNVVIEDNVEIGANTCVDRATMGSTILRRGVKLDNLIQVGHNVVVDQNTVAAAQVGIAGSTKVGKNCMFGGQVGISGHLTIASGTMVASQGGVASHVKQEGQVLMGSPAFDANIYRRAYIVYKQLPEMRTELAALRKELSELKSKL